MKDEIKKVYDDLQSFDHKQVKIGGWVKSVRESKDFAFMDLTAAFRFSSGFWIFPISNPYAWAVEGINCISPRAPAQDTAVVSNCDSWYACDAMRRQSQSSSLAYFLNSGSYMEICPFDKESICWV